jgi:hypothetical protein
MDSTISPFDCEFRDRCLRLLEYSARNIRDSTLWVVDIGRFQILWAAGSVSVYYMDLGVGPGGRKIIWNDDSKGWSVGKANAYTEELANLMILDDLSNA